MILTVSSETRFEQYLIIVQDGNKTNKGIGYGESQRGNIIVGLFWLRLEHSITQELLDSGLFIFHFDAVYILF